MIDQLLLNVGNDLNKYANNVYISQNPLQALISSQFDYQYNVFRNWNDQLKYCKNVFIELTMKYDEHIVDCRMVLQKDFGCVFLVFVIDTEVIRNDN